MVSLRSLSALFCILSFVNHVCQGIPPSSYSSSKISYSLEAFSEGICSSCHLLRGGSSAKVWYGIASLLAQNSGPAKAEPPLAGRKQDDRVVPEGLNTKISATKAEDFELVTKISELDASSSGKIPANTEAKITESLKISTLIDMNSEEDGAKASSPSSEESFSSLPIAALLAQNSGPAKAEPPLAGHKQDDRVVPEGLNTKISATKAEDFELVTKISELDASSSGKIPANTEAKITESLKISTLIDMNSEEASLPTKRGCSTCHLVHGGSSSEGSSESQPLKPSQTASKASQPASKLFSSELNSGTAEPSAQNAEDSASEISNQDAKISSNIDSKNKKSLKISTLLDMNPEEASSPEASKPTYQGCSSCHLALGGSSSVSQISEESSDSQSSFSEESSDSQPTFLEESFNPQPTLSSSSPAEDLDANILVENDPFLAEILAASPAGSKPNERGCQTCHWVHGGSRTASKASQPASKLFSSELNSGTAEPSAQNAEDSASEISNQDAKISSNIDSKNKKSLKISMLLDMNPEEASSPEASKPTYQGCSSCHLALGGSSSVSQISEESSDSQSSFSEESSDSQPTFLEESFNPQPTFSSPAEDLDANILVENDPFLAEILSARIQA